MRLFAAVSRGRDNDVYINAFHVYSHRCLKDQAVRLPTSFRPILWTFCVFRYSFVGEYHQETE